MAKSTLPTNFKDDILNASMNGKRKYNMIQNSDGTVSLEDASTYDQVGSEYGASQVNAANTAVNASADAGKIVDDIDDIGAITEEGYMAGALALKSVNNSLAGYPTFIYDSTGKIIGYKTKDGADTVFPFSSGIKCAYIFGYIGGTSAFYFYTKYKEDTIGSSEYWGHASNTTKEDEYLKIVYTASHKMTIEFYSKCTAFFADDTQTEYESGDRISVTTAYRELPKSIVFN